MKITVAQLKQIIAEEIKRAQLTEEQGGGGGIAFGDSPNPKAVRDAFLKLKVFYPYGEVPIQELAVELKVHVNLIDFNGTDLKVENTIVKDLRTS